MLMRCLDGPDDRQVFRHVSGPIYGAGELIDAPDQDGVHCIGDAGELLNRRAHPNPADRLRLPGPASRGRPTAESGVPGHPLSSKDCFAKSINAAD
jgi:hypothetical protein